MPSRHLARVRTFQAIYALKFKPKEKPEKLLKDDLERHPAKNMDEKLAFQLAKKYQKNRKKVLKT